MAITRQPLLILTLSLVCAAQAVASSTALLAQRHAPQSVRAVTDSLGSLRHYVDSLLLWRQHTHQGTQASGAGAVANGRFYRLFAPTTFYHSPASVLLGTHGHDEPTDSLSHAIDRALMWVYLHRPDLVVNSQRRLQEAGTIRSDITDQPMRQDFDLTEHVGSEPIDDPLMAPPVVMVKKPNFWSFSGDSYLQFLQNYVSDNWYKGGESNYSMIGNLTFQANYNNKSKLKFENKLELKLGFQTSRDDTLHKFKTNNDLIRYTGKVGLQATKQWYYSLQLIASTQFARGLKSNDQKVYSDFMSPFNLSIGIGMEYSIATSNNRLKGSVNMSALAFNFVYVDRKDIARSHGVRGNHHSGEDFGSQLTVDMTWTITDQIKWKTRFYAYTSYERMLMEWENTITLAVSKYISTNIFLYPRFDDANKRDKDFGYFQFKEYCSLGFSYAF